MRWTRWLLIALTVCALPTASQATERAIELPYAFGSTGDVIVACDGTNGGVCIDLQGDEETATIVLEDQSGQTIGAKYDWWVLEDNISVMSDFGVSRYRSLGEGRFCGSSAALEVPEGAERLMVFLDGPARAATGCGLTGGAGVATDGTIAVTFELTTVPAA